MDQRVREFKRRTEFGDTLLVFYLIVLTRQWFWWVDNTAAWLVTIPVAIVCWFFYVSTKDAAVNKSSPSFWIIVVLPLVFVYLIRVPFPDTSFDVWGLRLFHGERGLTGHIYLPGEFFPTAAPFNPTPDMLTGIFRHLLGYRLGTIINLLVLVWAGTILDSLLRPHIEGPKLRAALVLACLWVEHVLFEINNYMPDLLALPLLLEATRLVVSPPTDKRQQHTCVRVAFLIGAAVAIKLSNAAVALPIIVLCALQRRPRGLQPLAAETFTSLAVFAAPLIPFMVWVYNLTGNPIFPLYNFIFKSAFHPPTIGWDSRWGGFGAYEILAWPILIFFEPHRTAELVAYSGRLSLGFIIALVCVLFFWRVNVQIRKLVFILLTGTLLWSLTMGYIRYGLYLELLSGLLSVAVICVLVKRRAASLWLRGLAVCLCVLLGAQFALASSYVLRLEWSLRPTVFDQPAAFVKGMSYLLRDRSIRVLLNPRERELIDAVDVWVVSGAKTAGLMPLLNKHAPVVGVRWSGIYEMEASRRVLESTLDSFSGRRMFSIALGEDLNDALRSLRKVGLKAGKFERIVIPFYGPETLVYVYFFEVHRLIGRASLAVRTENTSQLPDDAFQQFVSAQNLPPSAKPGDMLVVFIEVTNASSTAWPSLPFGDGKYALFLRARWIDSDVQSARAVLPYDLQAGETVVLPLTLRAPGVPGPHLLEVGMVQEGVAAFGEKGSAALLLKLQIDP